MKPDDNSMYVAVVGIGCRFPGAKDHREYWKNLKEGKETLTTFTDQELRDSNIPEGEIHNPLYIKIRGIIEGIDKFDASFFHMSPMEAKILDPQQRVFLQCAWSALEDAGYYSEARAGIIGVFAGAGLNRYFLRNIIKNRQILEKNAQFHMDINNSNDTLATRVSYNFNFTGPSYAIQTACSTSLVAVSNACLHLLAGQCDMAIAGGVRLSVPNKAGYLYQEGSILSSDGHCRAFDKEASGTAIGDGVGVVVLKRLDDALRDEDHIYGIITGYATNNDGAAKVGYTAPSVNGQCAVIMEAQTMEDVDPNSITYVETHGTGTNQGDPIEIQALKKAFELRGAKKEKFCALGAVKTNIGHTDAASGIAGFIKAVLSIHYGFIPATLHFKSPNPLLDLEDSCFYVNTEYKKWGAATRCACVSSFGIGGTNAHVILEESPKRIVPKERAPYALIPLSALNEEVLKTYKQDLCRFLQDYPETCVNDLAYTFQIGRKAFKERYFLLASSVEESIEILKMDKEQERTHNPVVSGEAPSVAFLFSEIGTQYPEMGLDLYKNEPVFRHHIDQSASFLEAILKVDLRKFLYPSLYPEQRAGDEQSQHAQAILFIVEYALAKMWIEWGVSPKVLLGDSLGEYVAAAIAGVISLEEALTLITLREQILSLQGSHSPTLEALLNQFDEALAKIEFKTPVIPFVSNVSGNLINVEEATSSHYWKNHLKESVIYTKYLETILQDSKSIVLEMGPGNQLTHLGESFAKRSLITFPPKHNALSVYYFILKAAGDLWMRGVQIDWMALNKSSKGLLISAPSYPFEPQIHWISPDKQEEKSSQSLAVDASKKSGDSSPHPSDLSIEEELLQIWKEHLGLEDKKIQFTDNYFDLGGDSLLSIQIFKEINFKWNLNIPIHSLIEYPTISSLAAYISQEKKQIGHKEDHNQPFSLVKLKEGDHTISPLYLIHAVGGDVLMYKDLIKYLTFKGPIYGVRSRSIDRITAPVTTIEQMASDYIRDIQTQQTHGPYKLAGHSFGGAVAYEMAQQLAVKGEQIEFLALLDTIGPEKVPKLIVDEAEIVAFMLRFEYKHDASLNHLRTLSSEDLARYYLKHAAKKESYYGSLTDITPILWYFKILKANLNAIKLYQPVELMSQVNKVYYIKAMLNDAKNIESPEQRYKDLLKDKLVIFEVLSGHIEMVYEPHVREVAGIFNQNLIQVVN